MKKDNGTFSDSARYSIACSFSYMCNINQYKLLKKCSNKKDLAEWNTWRENNPHEEVYLQGADLENFYLYKANLQDAKLQQANCSGAEFHFANCKNSNFSISNCYGADFECADCQGAHFRHADCRDAVFWGTNCRNAKFLDADCSDAKFLASDCRGVEFFNTGLQNTDLRNVVFDNSTQFIGCNINNDTDCSNSSLSTIIIDQGTRSKLEQNIRRNSWNEWYSSQKKFHNKIVTLPIRFFWLISDYGCSTKRILVWFTFFIFLFSCIYTLFPNILALNGKQLEGANFWQMLAFSASTMVTLGFSNINVAITEQGPSNWGMLIVTLNLMVGYFMLAVLVTRLSILFQTMGPGHVSLDR